MGLSKTDKNALNVFKKSGGMLRTLQVLESGVHPRTLYDLRDRGLLEQVSRGVYRLAELLPLGNPDLVRVAVRVPKAVVCLISALHFHDLTSEIPHEVQIALSRGAKAPRLRRPPIRVFWFAQSTFGEGVEVHSVDGVEIRIYGPAKTVADCFKFRSKIGTDVALEALRSGIGDQRFSPAELMQFARICRVQHTIRPYLEAVL